MNKFINQVTKRIGQRLPSGKSFYTISDFEEAGLPEQVISQVEKELIRRMRNDLELPLTEWADLKSERMQQSWVRFVEEAEKQIRLPSYKLNALLKSIVNRTYPLVVWPRTQIVKLLFGKKEQLDYETLSDKISKIPARHKLSQALIRYMEKKHLEKLLREKAGDVIRQVDERLIQRYGREEWYRDLELLFELAVGKVPTGVLASSFYNRGKTGWSSDLSERKGSFSKEEFRQWLDEREDLQTSDRQEDPGEQSEPVSTERETADQGWYANFQRREETPETSFDEQSDSLHAMFGKKEEEESESVEETEEKSPESNLQDSTEEENLLNDMLNDPGDEEVSFPEETHDDREALAEEPGEHSPVEEPGNEREEVVDERETETDSKEEDEEEPIWRRFLEGSDVEVSSKDESDQDTNGKFSRATEHPSFQLNEAFKEEESEDEAEEDAGLKELRSHLEEYEKYYIREIFRGSSSDYREALRELIKFDNWKEAYPYIDREIFDRHDVELYSEAAVHFTDIMQNYFSDS